ncbi:acid-sensing ion channel 1-like [Asterias rubens]|uniref:acid-sensing ion channel 1-like n=1 Tax=Asterias rubens TaxID=7604 RepID=UPI0014556AA2|nr:acid-sensing ion channel 1-like [Asterias rubens]
MKDTKANEASQDLDREFASTTTLHGIGQVIDNQRVAVKLVWLGLLLGCMGVCSFQIIDRVKSYLEYNASTSLSVDYVGDLRFPAVTICNFNRYRKTALANESWQLKHALSAADYDYDSYDDRVNVSEPDSGYNFSYGAFTRRTGFIMDNASLLACSWRGKDGSCSAENFTHSFTSFGNCWTFNSGSEKQSEILSQFQSGSGNGLQLTIDIQEFEYTETIDGNVEAGLKVLVHDQLTPTLAVDSAGLAIAPGVHAFIAVRQIKHLNLGPPWGDCSTDKQLEYYRGYTLEGCTVECRARAIKKMCKCRLVRHPGDAPECSPEVVEDCATPTLMQLKSGVIDQCDCPIPCNYTEYSTAISTARLPNKNVAREFAESCDFDYINEAYIRDNCMMIDIYYDTMNYHVYKQSPAITTSALISDVGGQLGLFVGASFITLAEIIFYIARKVRVLMCTNKIKPSRDDVINIQGMAEKGHEGPVS